MRVGAQDEEEREGALCGECRVLHLRPVPLRVTQQSDDDERTDEDDVRVRGDREDRSRLAHASQVQRRDSQDHGHCHQHAVLIKAGHERHDRVHAGGDAHRHREHVVDEQG
jgi:hypothetical protein